MEYLVQYMTGWNVLILLFTLLISAFIAVCSHFNSIHRKYDHIPGPPREGFFSGNVPEFNRERKTSFFQQILLKWTQQYGHTFKMIFFNMPFVFTCDPDSVKDVLVTGHHPKSKEANEPARYLWGERFVGKGILNETDHKTWAFRRALINPCFMKSYVRNFTAEFNVGADVLMKKLEGMADGVTKVPLLDKFQNVTLDVLAKIGFGLDINSLETENSEFTKAIFVTFKGLSEKIRAPPFFALNPRKWKLMWDVRKAVRFLRTFANKVLQERMDAKERGDYIPDDILTHLIKINEENPEIDREVILDDFLTFFIAGQETTANLLGFIVEFLGWNPEILQRLKDEVDDVVGEKFVIEQTDIDRLVYLDMIIKETLRLASPASLTFRENTKDHVVGGYKVPKGTNIMVSSYVSGRLPEFFEDPEKFDPERFSPTTEKRYNTYTYFPFTLGPRTCVGKHFADIEAKIIMAKFIQRFNFDLDTSRPFEMEEITTIRPKGGAVCVLSLREETKTM